MNTRPFHCFFFLVASCFQSQGSLSAESQAPNILFMIADDLTFRDIGCYGSENVKTPHIDALAKKGMQFQFIAFACAARFSLSAIGAESSLKETEEI